MDPIFYAAITIAAILALGILLIIVTIKSDRAKKQIVIMRIHEGLDNEYDLIRFVRKYKGLSLKNMGRKISGERMGCYLQAKIKDFATLSQLLETLECDILDSQRKDLLKKQIECLLKITIPPEKFAEIYVDCLSRKADGGNTKREEKFILSAIGTHRETNKDLFREKVIAQMEELINSAKLSDSNESLERLIMLKSTLTGFIRIKNRI